MAKQKEAYCGHWLVHHPCLAQGRFRIPSKRKKSKKYKKNLFKISGESKPVLTESGPYAYEQKMERTDLKFSEDGTNIGYKIATRYFFSKGTIMLLEATVANDTFIVGSYNVIPLLNLLK